MEYNFKYVEALQQHNLTVEALPEDARIGIANIEQITKAIKMLENQKKPISDSILNKLRVQDKWVYYEILDHVNETDDNDDDAPIDNAQALIDEEKKKIAAQEDPNFVLGQTIEAELELMHKTGRKDWEIENIKPVAPKSYSVLFDGYEEGKENGITTSKYSLLETQPKVFTLTQK